MSRNPRRITTAILIILTAAALSAPGIRAGEKAPKPLSVDDVVDLEGAGPFAISPSEDWAAWVKTVSDKSKNVKVGNLFLTSLTDTVTLQLTRGKDGAGSPAGGASSRRTACMSGGRSFGDLARSAATSFPRRSGSACFDFGAAGVSLRMRSSVISGQNGGAPWISS